jgi:hypothetical protein
MVFHELYFNQMNPSYYFPLTFPFYPHFPSYLHIIQLSVHFVMLSSCIDEVYFDIIHFLLLFFFLSFLLVP